MKRVKGLFHAILATTVFAGASACGSADDAAFSAGDSESDVSAVASELSSHGLTKKQASTVLKLVDDICGDSWCEGDHNFHFDRIDCTRACGQTPGTCRLAFRMFPYDSDLRTGPTDARTCETPGFTGFGALVTTGANGYQSLDWDFYEALSACISKLESELPPV